MIAAVAIAIGIGVWPVNVAVNGESSYNCGSGFFHSGHAWKVDNQAFSNQATGGEIAPGLPSQVCPDKIYSRRDWALIVGSFALVVGLVTLALTSGPQDRSSRAIFASMRLRGR